MGAPVRSNLKELHQKLKSFVCSCKLKGDIMGYCTDDSEFVCKACVLEEHSHHFSSVRSIVDYAHGKQILEQIDKKPRCKLHPQESMGFYCMDENCFVCLRCHDNCDSAGHYSKSFDNLFDEKQKDFKEVCLKIDRLSDLHSSTYTAVDKFLQTQIVAINGMFDELIQTIQNKRKEILERYQQTLEDTACESGIFTPSLGRKWKAVKTKLEEANYCDFVTNTLEYSPFNTFWQQKIAMLPLSKPSLGSPETFLPRIRQPDRNYLDLTFLDQSIVQDPDHSFSEEGVQKITLSTVYEFRGAVLRRRQLQPIRSQPRGIF